VSFHGFLWELYKLATFRKSRNYSTAIAVSGFQPKFWLTELTILQATELAILQATSIIRWLVYLSISFF
jgi:hypothetical protein